MRKSILVVVENDDLRKAVLRFLTADPKDDLDAIGVKNRDEATRAMEAEPRRFDLVVTESGEPCSFWFFTSTLRQINTDVRIVLCGEDDSVDALRSYAEATVLKLEDDAARVLKQNVLRLLAA